MSVVQINTVQIIEITEGTDPHVTAGVPAVQTVDAVITPAPTVEVAAVGLQGPIGATGPPGTMVETRLTATYTTASLADGAVGTGLISMAKAFRLLSVVLNCPCRVRLYDRAAKQTADLNRQSGVWPGPDPGLTFEFVGTAAVLSANLSPQTIGDNMESIPSASIPITVTNQSGVTRPVTVQFVYVALG